MYPEWGLVDRIYRTRENLAWRKERGIRLNGPKLGRPPRDRQAYQRGGHPCVHPDPEPVQEAEVFFRACMGLDQEGWIGNKKRGRRAAWLLGSVKDGCYSGDIRHYLGNHDRQILATIR